MEKSTVLAIVLAPILGGLIWYLLLMPGRLISRLAYKHLPDGWLRRTLLRKTGVIDPDKLPVKLPPGP